MDNNNKHKYAIYDNDGECIAHTVCDLPDDIERANSEEACLYVAAQQNIDCFVLCVDKS